MHDTRAQKLSGSQLKRLTKKEPKIK